MSRAALPTAPAATPSAPASSPIRLRSVCQGRTGASRCELAREGGDDRERVGADAVQRPGRAAELHRQADAVQVVGGVVEAQHPARGLQPERRRLGLLEQRAADDRRVAMGLGELRRGVGRRAQVAEQRRQRALGHQHRRGVDRVLAGRAVVHGRVGQLPQALDHRPRRVADLRRSGADRLEVEVVELRGRRRSARRPSITPAPRLRVRERDLEVQQRLQPGAAGDPLGDAAAGEHAREDVRA